MPWEVPITVDGLEYPVRFNTESEPTQTDIDEAVKKISAQRENKPFVDVSDTLSATGRAFTSLVTTVPASLSQAWSGLENPWRRSEGYLQNQQEARALQEELAAADEEAIRTGDISSVSSTIREATPSLGFSVSTLGPSLVAGAGTGLATRNPKAAMAAAAGTSSLMAYRMAGAQFLDDARDRINAYFQENFQRLPNEQEQEEAYQELLPLARKFGAAEAVPEALGNLALGGAGKYIRRILGGKTGVQQLASGALSKVKGLDALKSVGAGVAGTSAELTTEGITEVLQQSPYTKLEEGVMRGVPVESVQTEPFTLERLGEGIERVAGPTLATTLLMGGLGAVGTAGYRRATRKDFEQNDFRDKLIQQSVTARRAMTDKGVTEADKANLTNKAEEAEAALKALNEGRSSDVEKYFNVRFIQPMVNPAISAAQGLNDAPASNPDASQAASAAQAEIEKAKAETERLAAEQAAEAARIAEEKRKAAASAIPEANVPPPPSPIITPDSTIDELQGELILRQNVRKTLDFGDQGNAQIDNDIQTLTQEIQSRSVTPPVVTTPPATSEAAAPAEPPSLPTRQAAAPAVGTPPTPTTTEDAAPKIPLEESLREEPQDRVEVRTPEETGAGDSLLRPARGEEEEVDLRAGLPRQQPGEKPDVIAWLRDNYSLKPISFVPKDRRRKETAEAEAMGILDELPFPVKRRLFSFDYGEGRNVANIDEIASLAYEANEIPSNDPTVLAQAIIEAFKNRKAGKSLIKEGEQQMETAEQRTLEFEKAVRERTAPLTLIPARDLGVGDVVQIGDDNMRVTFESDEDGIELTAAILTGPKFGEQRVDPNKPLKAEKHDTTNRIQDTSEFVPDEELEGVTPVPITPREEPTDATKGTVTPRGAAILPALEQPPVEAAPKQQPAEVPAKAPTVSAQPPAAKAPSEEIKDSAEIIDSTSQADLSLYISKGRNYYTLWFRRKGFKRNASTYLTILSTDLEEARAKAEEYLRQIASGEKLSIAFAGAKLAGLQGAKTVALDRGLLTEGELQSMGERDTTPVAERPIGFGQYASTKLQDIIAKDLGYAIWLAEKAKEASIRNYLAEQPEIIEVKQSAVLERERIKAFEEREAERKEGKKIPIATLVRGDDGVITAVEEPIPEPKKPARQKERKAANQIIDIIPPQSSTDNLDDRLKPMMFPSQIDGANATIDSLNKNGVALNSDGAGVGKTRQIIAVADYFAKQGRPVVIISENAALGKPWEGRKTPTLGGSMAKDSDAMGVPLKLLTEPPANGEIAVTTYNRVTVSDVPAGAVIIFDESHWLSNIFGDLSTEGKQDREWRAKFTQIIPSASAIAYYTATPADKPHQLAYLHKVLGFNTPEDYIQESLKNGVIIKKTAYGGTEVRKYDVPYSQSKKKKLYGWLNNLIQQAGREGRVIKREISYEGTDVQFQDTKGTNESKNPWAKKFNEVVSLLSQLQAEGWNLLNPTGAILYAAELAKIGNTINILKRELAAGRKSVVFFSRVNPFKINGRKYFTNAMGEREAGPTEVLGSIPSPLEFLVEELEKEGISFTELHSKSRTTSQKAQREFAGDKDVLLASVESGGTGINLDDTTGERPRTEIFMYYPYRGISTIQAMGRIWRASTVQNDNKPNRFVFITASDIGLDASRSAVLAKKLQLMNATLGGTAVAKLPLSKVSYSKDQLAGIEIADDLDESVVFQERYGVLRPVKVNWSQTRDGQRYWSKASADLLEWYERGGPDRTGADIAVFKSRDSGDWIAISDKPYKPDEFAPEGVNDAQLSVESAPQPAPETQPPAAEAVSPVVEPAPVEELAEETPEAETQAKKDAEIISRSEKDSLASLNRLISGEKTNATTGNVTLDDANTAMRQIEEARELPNIYFTNATTREEFLADPANESRFPAVWADLKANPNIEGLFDPTTGTAFVFTDKVAVSNLDRKLAEFFGTTPEVAAVRRVLIHESLHKGLGLLSTLDPSAHTAVMRYLNGLFTPEMLDARVADGYSQYSDWRINPDSKAKLIEEVFTEKISTGKELPKDGLWGEFIAVLKQIWRSITGKRGEPTVQDMKDVMRLITNSLRNEGKQRPDRTVGDDSVRFAIPFTRNLLPPEKYARHAELEAKHNAGTITPEETAEAQALVEEAAKAAGYGTKAQHKTSADFTVFARDAAKVYRKNDPDGFYFSPVGTVGYRGGKRLLVFLPTNLRDISGEMANGQKSGMTFSQSKRAAMLNALNAGAIGTKHDGGEMNSPEFYVSDPSQIKSADPFTGVPLEQRFQPTSPDIRRSIPVTHTSESAAISSSAQNAVTEISYTPRDFDVSLAIRRAFENLTRRAKQTSVTLEMLYNEALKGLGNMTRDEFGRMVQKAYDNNSALLTKGTADFPVFNRDGDRAGSVVLMARGPMASMIPPDAAPAASDNLRNGVDAAFDTENFAKYTGVPIKGRKAQDHISPDAEKIKEAAIQFVSEMIDARVQDGSSSSEAVMEVADTVANGEFGNKYLMGLPERGREPVWNYMLAELESRLRNASLKAAKRGQASTARQLEAKSEYLVDYWYSLGTQQGSNLQSRQAVITNPRYAWMFAEKEAKQRMQKNAEEAVAINAGDPGQLGDQVNRNADETDAEAGVSAGKKFDAVVEANEEAALLREGEAELDSKRRTAWERIKLLIRRLAFYAKADKMEAAPASRASLSQAEIDELNAILRMPKAERDKAKAKDLAELDALMAEFLGEDKPTDTPVETAKRSKRKRMVKVVEKIIFREGKDVEFRSVSTQDAVADLFNGADEYGKIVEEVGDALLSRVKQARGAGGAQTPIKQLVESIKRTLLGNLPTPKPAPPTNASLGKMLAMTFAQQIREAGLYADAWSKGRAEVRNLLAETGLKGEALDNELDSIMPPTPALAYAPNAARRTIALAMEQAGVTREQLTDGRINVAEDAKAKVMEAFDQAAAAVSLSDQGWSKQGKTGRQLAEQALNEAVQQWNTQDSNRVKISRIVAEQSESPVSEAEFADKLKSFNLKPAEITKLFDRAKNMAARRVELSEARAQQLIYALGEQFRQGSKDPDKSAGGDSINRAFRDQVSEPMTLDEFIQRLAKLNVGETVATRLFRTAAKERIDRKSMMIFDMLTGPRAASQMLERIARARRGIEMPLRSPISFVQLLSQKARTVNEYRKKVFDQIMASPDFADATEEQKERLADLFASVWQDQYAKIFAAKQARLEQSLLAKGKDRGAEALKAVRNEILESINLGVFNNDLLVRLMGEKFGIKTSFTEAEKARITELGEALQDDNINKALRNRMGRELVILMAKATEIPIAETLSNWWVSSVLSGPNTVFSIGAAFTNGAYEILGLGPARAIQKLLDGDMKGAVDNLMASVRGLGRYLKAFPEAFNRAWQYLWSGDVALLESAANDPLARIKTLADINRYESVAEILSKDPNAMKRFIGLYTRFWGRLLAALDAFNVMVTKRGALSIALRQSDLSIEQIRDMEEKVGLDIYKSNIVKTDPYFKGRMPRAGTYESALLNSMAEAQMYASLTKLGANIENADFTASQAAMTLNPTGAGGFIYNTLMGINAKSTSLANDFVRYAKARQSGDNKRTILDELELALAYFVQFAAYQAPNILGYRFARFAGNKFNQGVSFLPFIGMLRMFEKNQKQLKGSEAAFVDSIYRNQMISFVMLVVGQLVIKAIADEPDDEKRGWSWNGGWGNLTPEQIKQKLSAGEKQFTIRIGDRVFSYQNWPVNQMFAAIGSISDMIRFSPKEWADKGYLDATISTIVAGTSATMEIPALTQAGEIFGRSFASKDPTEQTLSRVERLAAGWLGGFTPRILKDLDMMADPKMRKYKTIWEKTASHIPIYRRFVGEEYYDILGKQIEKEVYPGSREFMERPSDPAYRILGALNSRNIWLTPANAEYRMVGKGRNRRRLTQEEADAYSLETGKAYKSMILRYGPRALQMSTERARAFLSDKADEVRDRALQKVYRGYRSRTSAQ